MPPPEIAEVIKKELSLEQTIRGEVQIVKCGCTNATPSEHPLFLPGKKGREYNWVYAESKAEQNYNFFILGTPFEGVRIHIRRATDWYYHLHNAPVDLWFETGKRIGDAESIFCYWHFMFYQFAELLTPISNEQDAIILKHQVNISLRGQGDGIRTYFEEVDKEGNYRPSPMYYMGDEQILRLFKDLVLDLGQASPTAAKYVREKFIKLRD